VNDTQYLIPHQYSDGWEPYTVPQPMHFDFPLFAPDPVTDHANSVPEERFGSTGIPDAEELPPPVAAGIHHATSQMIRHKKRRARRTLLRQLPATWWRHLFRFYMTALTVLTGLIVAMISLLAAAVCYPPLRVIASENITHTSHASLWPLLIFGPWLVASLSILRAAVLRCRAGHSWTVVILFSGVAIVLCTAHAHTSIAALSVDALPPITVLLSFHQLVRQIKPSALPAAAHAAAPPQRGAHRSPGASAPPPRASAGRGAEQAHRHRPSSSGPEKPEYA
jgi:hypothetical protein